MADINSVKISTLKTITFVELDALDQFVINDVDAGDITTKKLPLGGLIEFIESQELVFNNGILVNSHIKPPAGGNLNIDVDNILVNNNLQIRPGATVTGLLLNEHLDDVNVSNPKDGEILQWDDSNGEWINIEGEFGIEEAPSDGQIYARQDGKWVDITDLIDSDKPEFGFVSIQRLTTGGIYPLMPETFRVVMVGDFPTDIKFRWFVDVTNTDKVTITNGDTNTVTMVFAEVGTYTINCELSSDTVSNSPIVASVTLNVTPLLDYVLKENGEKIRLDGKNGYLVYEYDDSGTGPEPPDDEMPVFNDPGIYELVPEPYKSYLIAAVNDWSSLVAVGDWVEQEYPGYEGLKVTKYVEFEEAPGINGTSIAYVDEPRGYISSDREKIVLTTFTLGVNTWFKDNQDFTNDKWIEIFKHELGHALGVGVSWGVGSIPGPLNNYLDDVSYFSNAILGYNENARGDYTKIPLESSGGGGTQGVHWEDNTTTNPNDGKSYPGISNELMNGTISRNVDRVITNQTLGVIQDFGYKIIGDAEGIGVPATIRLPGIKIKCKELSVDIQ